jgi:hypothetical protein
MVDALRLAHRIVTPDGCVVDLHPTAAGACVEVGKRQTGTVDADDAPRRHAAAAAALTVVVDERLLVVESAMEFWFYTYADSLDVLATYISENWKNARIGEQTMRHTRRALRADPREKPRVRERVRITRLRPRSHILIP